MTQPVLVARHFTYRVNGQALLSDVSFEIPAGARCALIGPNGAGKSTLLKSVCRILPAGSGELFVAGRDLRSYSQKELARWVAYVPQTVGRDHFFTVEEFVLMGRYAHLSPFTTIGRQDREAVTRALDLTRITHLAHRRMRTLSGGEQQKVLIAAALAQGSRILLLDEPAAYLDPAQQDQVYELLERLHTETGLTLLEVTQEVNRAALWPDLVIGLRDGRVVFRGSPQDLMTLENLETIYGKYFVLAPHPLNQKIVALPGVRP
jgi:iron complex transport system ATP-binding protein